MFQIDSTFKKVSMMIFEWTWPLFWIPWNLIDQQRISSPSPSAFLSGFFHAESLKGRQTDQCLMWVFPENSSFSHQSLTEWGRLFYTFRFSYVKFSVENILTSPSQNISEPGMFILLASSGRIWEGKFVSDPVSKGFFKSQIHCINWHHTPKIIVKRKIL